jgi:hypothetical protein
MPQSGLHFRTGRGLEKQAILEGCRFGSAPMGLEFLQLESRSTVAEEGRDPCYDPPINPAFSKVIQEPFERNVVVCP